MGEGDAYDGIEKSLQKPLARTLPQKRQTALARTISIIAGNIKQKKRLFSSNAA